VFISVSYQQSLPKLHSSFYGCSLPQDVAILTSHPRDDSYTPSKISIRAGTTVHDLQEVCLQHRQSFSPLFCCVSDSSQVCSQEFSKPDGWVVIALRPGDAESKEAGAPIPAYHLRIVIVANHLNGKDTHVRGLRVYGPEE
jgi:anaphase-promoting complex subunit 10